MISSGMTISFPETRHLEPTRVYWDDRAVTHQCWKNCCVNWDWKEQGSVGEPRENLIISCFEKKKHVSRMFRQFRFICVFVSFDDLPCHASNIRPSQCNTDIVNSAGTAAHIHLKRSSHNLVCVSLVCTARGYHGDHTATRETPPMTATSQFPESSMET